MGCAGGSDFGAGVSLLCLAAGVEETSRLGDLCSASTAGRQMSRPKIWIPVFTGKPRFLVMVGLRSHLRVSSVSGQAFVYEKFLYGSVRFVNGLIGEGRGTCVRVSDCYSSKALAANHVRTLFR